MAQETPKIHTYHCLCSTLILATPYALSSLPQRAPPSLDHAYILPLPPLSATAKTASGTVMAKNDTHDADDRQEAESKDQPTVLPSLLTGNLRPARKATIIRREDGFEKRKALRCGRCGIGIGYEIINEDKAQDGARVLYLLNRNLVETEDMGKADDGFLVEGLYAEEKEAEIPGESLECNHGPEALAFSKDG
ncbi:hypothetical protein ACLMJK_005104 [Lecanora helva]